MNPVLIRLFDDNKGKVSVRLLDMGTCKEGTAEALFNNINSILRENRVDWENCVAVGLDTAVNVGKKNSIMTRVLAKNKNIFINGCPCHIIHNTANKAAERFSEVSRFDVEDFIVDLFHWFDKSFKRKVTPNFQPKIIDLSLSRLSAFFFYKSVTVYVYLRFEYDIFSVF